MPAVWNARFAGEIAGCIKSKGYIHVSIDGYNYLSHRIIWAWMYEDPGSRLIDHRNSVRSDNSIENLRCVGSVENQRNRKGQSRRGLPKGVEFDKRNGKYRAFLSLGSFDNVDEAAAAYEKAAAAAFGEFAYHLSVSTGKQEPSPTYNRRVLPRGVSWSTQKQAYIARIHINRKEHHLGTFRTPEAASDAYQNALNSKLSL